MYLYYAILNIFSTCASWLTGKKWPGTRLILHLVSQCSCQHWLHVTGKMAGKKQPNLRTLKLPAHTSDKISTIHTKENKEYVLKDSSAQFHPHVKLRLQSGDHSLSP